MMDWLEQQRTRLHGFYRTEYRYSLRITAIAFGALILLGFAVSLLLPDLADQLFLQFAQQMAELGIMDTTGRVDVLALFGNNLSGRRCSASPTALSPLSISRPCPSASTPCCWGCLPGCTSTTASPCWRILRASSPTAFSSCRP